MSNNGSVARMVDGVLSRQATARAGRNGETHADAMAAVLLTEAGRQLAELRDGRYGTEWAHRWQAKLAPKRTAARMRARHQESERASEEAAWKRFVQTQMREMELRKEGQLAGVLDAMRGATPAPLRRLASQSTGGRPKLGWSR